MPPQLPAGTHAWPDLSTRCDPLLRSVRIHHPASPGHRMATQSGAERSPNPNRRVYELADKKLPPADRTCAVRAPPTLTTTTAPTARVVGAGCRSVSASY